MLAQSVRGGSSTTAPSPPAPPQSDGPSNPKNTKIPSSKSLEESLQVLQAILQKLQDQAKAQQQDAASLQNPTSPAFIEAQRETQLKALQKLTGGTASAEHFQSTKGGTMDDSPSHPIPVSSLPPQPAEGSPGQEDQSEPKPLHILPIKNPSLPPPSTGSPSSIEPNSLPLPQDLSPASPNHNPPLPSLNAFPSIPNHSSSDLTSLLLNHLDKEDILQSLLKAKGKIEDLFRSASTLYGCQFKSDRELLKLVNYSITCDRNDASPECALLCHAYISIKGSIDTLHSFKWYDQSQQVTQEGRQLLQRISPLLDSFQDYLAQLKKEEGQEEHLCTLIKNFSNSLIQFSSEGQAQGIYQTIATQWQGLPSQLQAICSHSINSSSSSSSSSSPPPYLSHLKALIAAQFPLTSAHALGPEDIKNFLSGWAQELKAWQNAFLQVQPSLSPSYLTQTALVAECSPLVPNPNSPFQGFFNPSYNPFCAAGDSLFSCLGLQPDAVQGLAPSPQKGPLLMLRDSPDETKTWWDQLQDKLTEAEAHASPSTIKDLITLVSKLHHETIVKPLEFLKTFLQGIASHHLQNSQTNDCPAENTDRCYRCSLGLAKLFYDYMKKLAPDELTRSLPPEEESLLPALDHFQFLTQAEQLQSDFIQLRTIETLFAARGLSSTITTLCSTINLSLSSCSQGQTCIPGLGFSHLYPSLLPSTTDYCYPTVPQDFECKKPGDNTLYGYQYKEYKVEEEGVQNYIMPLLKMLALIEKIGCFLKAPPDNRFKNISPPTLESFFEKSSLNSTASYPDSMDAFLQKQYHVSFTDVLSALKAQCACSLQTQAECITTTCDPSHSNCINSLSVLPPGVQAFQRTMCENLYSNCQTNVCSSASLGKIFESCRNKQNTCLNHLAWNQFLTAIDQLRPQNPSWKKNCSDPNCFCANQTVIQYSPEQQKNFKNKCQCSDSALLQFFDSALNFDSPIPLNSDHTPQVYRLRYVGQAIQKTTRYIVGPCNKVSFANNGGSCCSQIPTPETVDRFCPSPAGWNDKFGQFQCVHPDQTPYLCDITNQEVWIPSLSLQNVVLYSNNLLGTSVEDMAGLFHPYWDAYEKFYPLWQNGSFNRNQFIDGLFDKLSLDDHIPTPFGPLSSFPQFTSLSPSRIKAMKEKVKAFIKSGDQHFDYEDLVRNPICQQ